MLTLPSGIKKYESTDNATVDNFNVNAGLIDTKITELNTHEAATSSVHGSTNAATANRIIQRDSAGRAKVAAPAAADDIARKDTVDNAMAAYVPKTSFGFGATGGSVNSYTVTLSPAPTTLDDGMCVAVKINAANTGAATINVNGLGAKPIKKANGNDVASGNLKAASIYTLRYNSTTGNFILQGDGGNGTAQAGDVLSGKTFSNDSGDFSGTMPNNGAGGTVTPGTANQTKAAGYYSSAITVLGDADFIPSNIRSGVTLFGLPGTLVEGKRYASGTATGSNTYISYNTSQSSSYTMFNVTVSGLSFTPSYIILYRVATGADNITTLYNVHGTYAGYTVACIVSSGGLNMAKLDGTNAYVTSTGFQLPHMSSIANAGFAWIAFE